jgi:hypothetical protein
MRPSISPSTLFLSVTLSVSACASAIADDKPTWTMNKDNDQVALIYGDGSEESELVLTCKPRSNSVRFFIGETDKSLKPYKKVTASVTVGATKVAIRGKTMPNELAGVPSFVGNMSASDPLFDAMAGAPTIAFKVGKTASEIPLKTMGGKAASFSKACRKP